MAPLFYASLIGSTQPVHVWWEDDTDPPTVVCYCGKRRFERAVLRRQPKRSEICGECLNVKRRRGRRVSRGQV